MKIGLIDVDARRTRKYRKSYPNLALAKIAAWHRAQGDDVSWYDDAPYIAWDRVYMSKIFSFTPDYPYVVNAKEIVRGGTGYDVGAVLPREVDDMQPDLSIYPDVREDVSFGFLTRGCPNKCKWCVVPRKEGGIIPYWDVDRVANGRAKLILMDNNILASGDYGKRQLRKIIERGYRVDFNQGLDARLVTDEWADLLAKVKWIDRMIRFGCDTRHQIEDCQRAADMLKERGFRGRVFLYCILGTSDFAESYDRVNYWREQYMLYKETKGMEGTSAVVHAQPYIRIGEEGRDIPQWEKDMAHWTNKRNIWVATDFGEFTPRKGFKCKEYFNIFNYINYNRV